MKQNILLAIFAICLVFSTILAFTPTEKICSEKTSSCSIVQNSDYKKTLGINNSYFGIIVFTALILLTVSNKIKPTKNKNKTITILVAASSIAAIYFIFLQAFIIKAFCKYCMVVDTGTILALAIILTIKNK